MNKAFSNKCFSYALWAIFLLAAISGDAYAQDVNKIAKNIVTQSDQLPGLIAVCAYIIGILLGISGVLKLKEHVLNPSQAPLRTPIIRFLAGGALFALPIITEAMLVTINGQPTMAAFNPSGTWTGWLSGLLGGISGLIPTSFSGILTRISSSIDELPGLLSAVAYLLGLIMAVSGTLKLKDHVENPDQTPLREGTVRLLTGGALFGLPVIYAALFNTIGGATLVTNILSLFGAGGMIFSTYGRSACNPLASSTLGDALCSVVFQSAALPAFLNGVSYMIGIVLGLVGILKIKAHVLDPSRTSLWEGLARLLAGALFLAFPVIKEVVANTITNPVLMAPAAVPVTTYNNGSSAPTCNSSGGLSTIVFCTINSVYTPMHVVLNFFVICAGSILIMVGISRLIKSTQEGPKGPGGMGTLMTFTMGGVLLSYNQMMRAVTGTIFGNPLTQTRGTLQYVAGMTQPEQDAAHVVITSIIKLMILVGLISFVRGIFIVRGVAEGNSQSSLMAGMTHIIGGALAVNLGPLINAVQTTLGIAAYGIRFT